MEGQRDEEGGANEVVVGGEELKDATVETIFVHCVMSETMKMRLWAEI